MNDMNKEVEELNFRSPYPITEDGKRAILSLGNELLLAPANCFSIPYETPSFYGVSAAGLVKVCDKGRNVSTSGLWLYNGIPVGKYQIDKEGGESCSTKYAGVYSCLKLEFGNRLLRHNQCLFNPLGKDQCDEIILVRW